MYQNAFTCFKYWAQQSNSYFEDEHYNTQHLKSSFNLLKISVSSSTPYSLVFQHFSCDMIVTCWLLALLSHFYCTGYLENFFFSWSVLSLRFYFIILLPTNFLVLWKDGSLHHTYKYKLKKKSSLNSKIIEILHLNKCGYDAINKN